MKIALAQLNYIVGDFDGNEAKIREAIRKAREERVALIVFSELCVCGYPPRDFLGYEDFIQKSADSVGRIAEECRGITAVIGAPVRNDAPRGKPLSNVAFVLADGRVNSMARKTLLPNYDVFDEYRYFEPNRHPFGVVEAAGVRIALTICEDLWNLSDDPLYVRNPMDELCRQEPQVIVNIAASPFSYEQPGNRREVLARNAVSYGIPVIYVNQVGGQTELIFDGGSLIMGSDGREIVTLKRFEEEVRIVDLDLTATGRIAGPGRDEVPAPADPSKAEWIRDALVLGIRDYFHKTGFTRAILGLSGGIDSAVTLVLAAEALGAENVRAVLLPSPFSSGHSITDAADLAKNLGVDHEIIPIGPSYDSILLSLRPDFQGLPFNLTEENLQARIRAVILMALSNKLGYILLNTSNKSEAATGYGTLYGDMCGGLSVLGDVYKTEVYELAALINRDRTVIPVNTITKAPSAELRPEQKDSDSLPEYDILDRILYLYLEKNLGPGDIAGHGFDPDLVRRVLRLVDTSEYKRYQAPPVLRVSPKAFGMGRRMPIAARYR